VWYVARLRDARLWNSAVNTKEKQLCNFSAAVKNHVVLVNVLFGPLGCTMNCQQR
jgi:hypothetical protein